MVNIPRNIRRLLVLLLATISITSLASLAPANAAALNWTSRCGDYQNYKVWKTSTQWARVSNRACVEWTTNSNQVRAREDLRIDWPGILTCKASTKDGLSCEATHAKVPMIVFKYATFELWWNMHGALGHNSCTLLHNYVASHSTAGGTSTKVGICRGPIYYVPNGAATGYAAAGAIAADVADDGDGEKTLDRTTDISVGLQNN